MKRIVVPDTGRYFVEVVPVEPAEGVVLLFVKVRAPRLAASVVDVGVGTPADVQVATLSGSRVTIVARRAKGQTVEPTILSVKDAGGTELLVPGELRLRPKAAVLRMRTPVPGGTLTVTLGAVGGDDGQVSWRISIKPPKGYVHTELDLAAGSTDQ